jgi:glycolate oxidase iron-sulfur subunit
MGAGERSAGESRSAASEEFGALHAHVTTCSKCGFCQPVCPIFRATGREGHAARGKVALYRNVIEGRLDVVPATKDVFANCLLCRACTESCFPAVRTDDVVISFRHGYAERFGRGFMQRRVFRDLLPRPRLMRALVRIVWTFRKTGLDQVARRMGLVGLLNPKLERALELGAGRPGKLLSSRLRKRTARACEEGSTGDRRPRIGYWMACGYNYVLPEVGESTVRVLERMGFAVEVLDNCCCGLAAYGYGDREAAGLLARENLRRLGDLGRFEAVVSECGSCSGHLKEYARILAGDSEWSTHAGVLKDKTRSFSEFIVERGGLVPLVDQAQCLEADARADARADSAAGAQVVVTYHDPCHLGHRYQDVVEQPRQILRSIPGVIFREAAEADSCCGAAGTYGILHPETSGAIVDRKTGFIRETGAAVVATECPSCMMQLSLGAQRAGLAVSVLNLSQICDRATGGGRAGLRADGRARSKNQKR